MNCSNSKIGIISYIQGHGREEEIRFDHTGLNCTGSTPFFFFNKYKGLRVLGFCFCGFNQLQIETYFRSSVGNLWIPSVHLSHMGIFSFSGWEPLTIPPPPASFKGQLCFEAKTNQPDGWNEPHVKLQRGVEPEWCPIASIRPGLVQGRDWVSVWSTRTHQAVHFVDGVRCSGPVIYS